MKFIFSFILFSFVQSQANENLILGIGTESIIKIKPGSIIRLTNSKAVQVQDMGNSVRIVGKSTGYGLLLVQSLNYEIQVLSKSQYQFFKTLESLLKLMMGLKLEVQDQQIFIKGELLRFSDWLKISNLAKAHQAEWVLNTKMSVEVEQEARKYFLNQIFDNQLPSPSMLLQPQPTVLISKDNESSKPRYLNLLKTAGFKIEVTNESVSMLPAIEIAVQIAEFKKSNFLKIGIQPPAGITATLSSSSTLSIDPTQFAATLHMMQSKGEAKILANPRLICRSGKEAQFLAGGEFPIKIFNYKVSDIQWKKHGIVLKIKPNADRHGRMNLYVNAEISIIDNARMVDGIPGLLVNRVETYIDLAESKTIALSGLIKQDWGKSRAGLPLLSDIPLLNNLFSSEDFRNEQTDLIIFLTPKVMGESNG